ncbi:hypothetical protein LCGC14_1042470 [marine sediment metagenome]|uniref:Tyr recombinase domain-containing protein n=1 Tax=marine sediment metagenome TaxID=412755 RepID=A0A0F9MVR9_9ZZZZ
MTLPTLLSFCTDCYLPTRLGMAKTSAAQLQIAARLYEVSLSALDELELARRLATYSKDHSPSTVNSKRRAILTLWSAAAEAGLCRPPNRKRIPRAREMRRIPWAWTTTELERLISVCRSVRGTLGDIPAGIWWPSIVLTIWDTGMRIGALLSITTSDLNLAERYAIVRAEADKSCIDRYYPLSDQSTAAIAGHFCPHRDRAFPWPYGRRQLFYRFRKIVTAAGLKSRKTMGLFHQLRRSNLSYTAAGGGVALAQQQAGHASSATTVRHYLDPRIAQQRSAIDVLPTLNLSGDKQLLLF